VTGLDPIADSPERAELRAIVRRAIADVSPPERITELDEAETFDEALHQKLARAAFATVGGEGLHAAAACIGAGRGALDLAVSYAKERVVFGRPIGGLQVPQHWLVDGALALEAARSLLWRATAIALGGGDSAALAAMAKLAASEAAVTIAHQGMQLMGGMGYTRDVAMQRFFRDARLWTFSPLANEMVRDGLGERQLALPRSY
jgi:alkylation response protein AidB-like acyl-CoA dehydrogenase